MDDGGAAADGGDGWRVSRRGPTLVIDRDPGRRRVGSLVERGDGCWHRGSRNGSYRSAAERNRGPEDGGRVHCVYSFFFPLVFWSCVGLGVCVMYVCMAARYAYSPAQWRRARERNVLFLRGVGLKSDRRRGRER